MEAESIMDGIAEKANWDEKTQLALALEYIENQGANDAFADFLQQEAEGGLF